ncbi:recombinase family protein [Sinorhizobium medicae]|uniref:recombinase family protein n=1 Tax=Sinorhizobium medicae TaxID=110321 RepID=UPI001F455F03|nr:recombinase family protein [Sinorhizobium medicae]
MQRLPQCFLSGIAEFERDLISERVTSGLSAAKARGKKLGRQPGQRPKADRLEGAGAHRGRPQLSLDRSRSCNQQEYSRGYSKAKSTQRE